MMPADRLVGVLRTARAVQSPPGERLAAAFELLRHGLIEDARTALEQVRLVAPELPRLHRLSQACARIRMLTPPGTDGADQRVHLEGRAAESRLRPTADVMILPCAGARRALVAFGGFTDAFWLTPAFLGLLDCHLVILSDSRRMFHLAGLIGLGESYAECVAGLQRLLAELGATSLFLAGSSAGGYAALRYGLDLEVRGVLAVSPVTQINAGAKEIAQYPALAPIASRAPEMMQDLIPLYQRASRPPPVLITWGQRNRLDDWQAARMAVLPNVTLEPVPVADHPVWMMLQATDRFAPLLHRLLCL